MQRRVAHFGGRRDARGGGGTTHAHRAAGTSRTTRHARSRGGAAHSSRAASPNDSSRRLFETRAFSRRAGFSQSRFSQSRESRGADRKARFARVTLHTPWRRRDTAHRFVWCSGTPAHRARGEVLRASSSKPWTPWWRFATRIPLATTHPDIDWIGSKLRVLVLNRADMVSDSERSKWVSWFKRNGETHVVLTDARSGKG